MENKILTALAAAFKECGSVEKGILFGSRARGDNGERSDYDIAVTGNITDRDRIKIFDAVEYLPTLLKIDLVYFDKLEEGKFKENIKKDGIVFYDREAGK